MAYQVEIYSDADSVEKQLARLGLTREQLRIAVSQGQAARNNATNHHPSNAGGTMAFFEVVRTLRDLLVANGWINRMCGIFQ